MDISILSRLVSGSQRSVDISSNTLVVTSIKVGGSGSNTELTKALLDALLAISSDLASTANGKGASLVGIEDAGSLYTATQVEAALAEVMGAANSAASAASAAQSTADAAIPETEKGANNGVATLDSGGKVPVAQLPNSIMEYQGTFDPTGPTPALADGTGDTGDVYRVNVAGAYDFGSGSITFVVGDYAIYNGATWEKAHSGSDAVISVNGQSGAVTLTTSNITEGSNLYYTAARFNTAFSGKSTSDLTEGSNLYFTDTRAKTAAVVNSLGGSQTDQAPSVAAVNAALSALTGSGSSESLNAGESFSSGALRAVRWAKAADAGFTAGRVYKADYDSTSADNFHAVGLVKPGSGISAGQAMTVYKSGPITATGHGFTVGEPIYLTAAGALSNTAPSTSLQAVVKVGMARDANTIEVQIQIMGVN